MKLRKVCGYYFPHLSDGPQISHLFFKWPLVGTGSDMPNLDDVTALSVEQMYSHIDISHYV
jgi:hypothetical protein